GTVVVAALEAAPKRRPIDQVAVQRPHVLAVITPLRCLEPAAIFVLFDGLESAALRFEQGAPPPVARGVEIERARLAKGVAHSLPQALVAPQPHHDPLPP